MTRSIRLATHPAARSVCTDGRRANRRPLVAGALAAIGVVTVGLLSACSAGQIAQTAQVEPGVPGVNVQAPGKPIYIRNAALDYPGPKGYAKGANAPLSLWIFNDTEQPISLVGVAGPAPMVLSDGANSAAPCSVPRSLPPVSPFIINSGNPASPTVSGSAAKSSASSKTSASPSGSGFASASPSPSPSPSFGSSTINVTIPAGGCVELSHRAAHYLQIVGLPDTVDTAGSVPTMFSFTTEGGQPFTIGTENEPVKLPVAVPESPLPHAS